MSVYVLECSVCEGTFDSRKEWLNHLLQPHHQLKAREAIYSWGQAERDCALVTFSSRPIASLDLLHFLSVGSMTLVTDFVWFDTRPNVGFVQFESKEKVEELLARFGGRELRIQNDIFQMKLAGLCLDLEWESHLPPVVSDFVDLVGTGNANQEVQSFSSPDPLCNANQLINRTGTTDESQAHGSRGNYATPLPIPGGNEGGAAPGPHPHRSLSRQYEVICQEIEISDEEYKTAQNVLLTLKKYLSSKFPACQLVWFRNWYLKLKPTSSSNDLTFFVDQKGLLGKHLSNIESSSNDFPEMTNEKMEQLFINLPELDLAVASTSQVEGGLHQKILYCRKNRLNLSLVPAPFMILPEIQTCRLVEYYCSFDRRVKPLLSVMRYWAKENGIRLDKPSETSYKLAPEPAALDWLVLFFLCHKTKMLPPPREITELSQPKLNYFSVNIGITTDPTLARTNSRRYKTGKGEPHFLNVFNLTKKLFNFYSHELALDKGKRVVLNLMDGEVLPVEKFYENANQFQSKLTSSERSAVRDGLIDGIPIYLLHPLYIRHGFSFCYENFIRKVLPAMKITKEKLERGLELYKGGNELDLKSALKVNV